MLTLDPLRQSAGHWAGTSCLFLPPDPARECASNLLVTPVLGGSFVRLDYTWSFDGASQEGMLLIGCEAGAGQFTAVWADSWHMGDKLLLSQGQSGAGAALSVRGSYAVEGHPDWGWRTVLQVEDDGALRLLMFNISPEGEEYPAVDGLYRRAPTVV